MILNKREMQLARELARKITRKNDLNDEEVLDVVMGFISDLKRVVIDAWNHIKEAVNEFIELIHETETEKKHAYNWHVPKNIIKNHQVLDRKPLVANIRNNL